MDFIVPQNIEIKKNGIVIKAQRVVMASMVNGISFYWASSFFTFFFKKTSRNWTKIMKVLMLRNYYEQNTIMLIERFMLGIKNA